MSIALLMMIKDEFKSAKNIIKAIEGVCDEKIIEYLPDEILWFIDKDATNVDRGFLDLDLVFTDNYFREFRKMFL